MLDQVDAMYVRTALANELSRLGGGDPRGWLVPRLGDEFGLKLGYSLGDAQQWANAAYRICAEDQWDHEPCMLYLLTMALPQTARAAAIANKLAKRPPAPADPAKARWLATGYPLLDRDNLKASVMKLVPENGKIILTVNGPTKCGKSYTAEYIQYLASSYPNDQRFRIARLTLAGGTGSTYEPRHLFNDLVRKMEVEGKIPERGTTPMNAWLRDICGELIYLANRAGRWWWVLDGYCASDLNRDTRTMIGELTRQATEGEAARRVRIILLD
jgi:hypothetical protein